MTHRQVSGRDPTPGRSHDGDGRDADQADPSGGAAADADLSLEAWPRPSVFQDDGLWDLLTPDERKEWLEANAYASDDAIRHPRDAAARDRWLRYERRRELDRVRHASPGTDVYEATTKRAAPSVAGRFVGLVLVMVIMLALWFALGLGSGDDDARNGVDTGAADTVAGGEPDAHDVADDGAVDEAQQPVGGQPEPETPPDQDAITIDSRSVVSQGPMCLERRTSDPASYHSACGDDPGLAVVVDPTDLTLEGAIDAVLACPGAGGCFEGRSAEATVTGGFGPHTYGRYPDEIPADFPFPDHHWYDDDITDWWVGAPIELTITMAGSYAAGDGEITVDDTTTVTGWLESTLWPSSVRDGVPADWNHSMSIRLDQPDTADPNWWMVAAYSGLPLGEVSIAVPPWDD